MRTNWILCDPRFLLARNLDLDEAEKMWRASMVWRKEFGVDALAKDFRAQMNGEKPKSKTTTLPFHLI